MSEIYQNIDDAPQADFPWLHGPIGRSEVAELMRQNGNQEGLYLVRESARVAGGYVLSCIAQGSLQHYVINGEGGVYRVDDGPPFQRLDELVNHYHKPDDRLPTVLTTYVPKPGAPVPQQATYENMWNAQHTVQATVARSQPMAQQPSLAQTTQQMQNMSVGSPQVSVEPGVAYATSLDAQSAVAQSPSTSFGAPLAQTPASPAPAASKTSTMSKTATLGGGGTRDFKKAPSVQSWIQKSEEVMKQEVKVTETLNHKSLDGLAQTGTEGADLHFQKFDRAARAEEKMYLMWMNDKLRDSGKSIEDLGPSLKNGVLVMEVLIKIAHLPPLKYTKRPLVVQQERDNWEVIVKFMRKLGIQVDPLPMPGGEGAALNPLVLHEGERREMLKLFSKLMLYEAYNPK